MVINAIKRPQKKWCTSSTLLYIGPTGTYKIRSFLFKEGKLMETDMDTLKVEQVGLNAFVFEAAHKHEALYGAFCVILALVSGWFVGILRVRA